MPISNFDWILPIQGTFILSNGKWEHPNLELDEYVNHELNIWSQFEEIHSRPFWLFAHPSRMKKAGGFLNFHIIYNFAGRPYT